MSEEQQEDKPYKPKSYYMQSIPKDIYDMIIAEQAKLKTECGCQKNMEHAIYSLIRKKNKL